MAVNITRCPHCKTTFRVRDEHLSVAKGMVRCGSCLQVFKAADYFIKPTSQEVTAPQKPTLTIVPTAAPESVIEITAVPETPDATAPAESDFEDAIVEIFADDTPTPEASTVAAKVETAADEDDFLISDDADEIHDDMDDSDLGIDSGLIADDPNVDFGLRTPEQLERPRPNEQANNFDFDFDSSVMELDNAGDLPFGDFLEEENNLSTKNDESWLDALLDDDELEQFAEQTSGSDEQSLAAAQTNKSATQNASPQLANDDFSDIFADSSLTAHNESLVLASEPSPQPKSFSARMTQLQDDPLQFQEDNKAKRPWGWLLASLLLLILVAAQFFYFNFDNLSRAPQWRPFYQQACSMLGCQLPANQDMSKLTTQLFSVKVHPHYQGALLVETLLLNKADYDQPFPDILLSFKDLNDRVVASRRFKPSQYLSGEMAGQNSIPSRTPVHIAIEVINPGADAVSYNINLLANH